MSNGETQIKPSYERGKCSGDTASLECQQQMWNETQCTVKGTMYPTKENPNLEWNKSKPEEVWSEIQTIANESILTLDNMAKCYGNKPIPPVPKGKPPTTQEDQIMCCTGAHPEYDTQCGGDYFMQTVPTGSCYTVFEKKYAAGGGDIKCGSQTSERNICDKYPANDCAGYTSSPSGSGGFITGGCHEHAQHYCGDSRIFIPIGKTEDGVQSFCFHDQSVCMRNWQWANSMGKFGAACCSGAVDNDNCDPELCPLSTGCVRFMGGHCDDIQNWLEDDVGGQSYCQLYANLSGSTKGGFIATQSLIKNLLGEKPITALSTQEGEKLVELCNTYPGACQPSLNESCQIYKAESLTPGSTLQKLCGCHLPDSEYSKYADLLQNQVHQCAPVCQLPGTVFWATQDSKGNWTIENCTQDYCIIDDVTIDLINSSAGNINLSQACSNCSGGQCVCVLNDVDIKAVDSSIGDVEMNQVCKSGCYDSNLNKQTCDQNIKTLTNDNSNSSITSLFDKTESKFKKFYSTSLGKVVVWGAVVFIVLFIIFLVIYFSTRKKTGVKNAPQPQS
jgi:hypothetical protein